MPFYLSDLPPSKLIGTGLADDVESLTALLKRGLPGQTICPFQYVGCVKEKGGSVARFFTRFSYRNAVELVRPIITARGLAEELVRISRELNYRSHKVRRSGKIITGWEIRKAEMANGFGVITLPVWEK